ncbi:CHASE2 domain-containing protein [Sphingomonas sp. G124]|uniref:CHASE2 domain-containing protein n=1 Tax=Sphingomonas cremea TaxID=2904799 RepID=A0A9X1QK79_9SPHN|nr:CHASE2 domain-containing protein [Sphingomonas cremea]MCF2514905.1 CHASE2 domain-containing protein [Sphingomonas cremea]
MSLIAVFITLTLGERMQRGVFDSWQEFRPRDLSQSDVRVVLIDNESIEMVGSWPWSRYYLARLTEELAARKAKVIAFDIFFPEHDQLGPANFVSLYPELNPDIAAKVRALEPMDQFFGKVIGAAPVVLGHAGVDEAPEGQAPIADAPIDGTLPKAVDSWPAELAAIPELDDVALGHGLVNVKPESDGIVRSIPLVMRAAGKPRPGFALEIARDALDAETIAVAGSSIGLDSRRIPMDHRGRMRLHFGAFPADKIISAADVLGDAKHLKPDTFAGKAVLIGLSADGTSDIAATPIGAEEFGPLVQAQAVDAILRGGWLERPAWAGPAEWAAAALLALLALGSAIFGRAYRIFVAAIFLSVPILSWFAFANAKLLLDPARPLLVGGGAVAGVALGLFALARIDRERLRDTLVQERIVAAENEGELHAARAIQIAMVPPRSRLRNLDPRVDIDALLEPAKSVGGDFYDAMKIADDRIGFAIADVTGKGVPAALFMAMSKALTSAALSRMEADPVTMAEAINAELLKDNSEAMSVTMILGILDLATGEVRMVCAGHEDPLLISATGEATRVRLDGGPPFSITEFPYPREALKLRPGETLVLVTDGVTEAQNAQGALFGSDRILSEIRAKTGSAVEICENIRVKVREFEDGTEATDDLTVMAVRYLG